jgi:histidinol dehydrogenase
MNSSQILKIIKSDEFDGYWKTYKAQSGDEAVIERVRRIIGEVRRRGDDAVREFARGFDKSSPDCFEVSPDIIKNAFEKLRKTDPELADALELAKDHIFRFALEQKKQFFDFEYEVCEGVIAGQRVIPVERAAIYAPAGRFPLISSVLMGVLPALAAGVEEVYMVSPPLEDGLPDWRILAASYLAGASHVFAIGGAQAIAALALGTESVPRVDVIAGAGNKYVATAKRLLYGEVGIDFFAGPTDVLIVAGKGMNADSIAADMLAQAEHDPDARARALTPDAETAYALENALEQRLSALPDSATARASLSAGGLLIIYETEDEAIRIADTIAPEHLELQGGTEKLASRLKNYGALFIGEKSAEVLGDYSAGTNHTLPTSGSARFSGGLSVRHFLKTATTLRCTGGKGYMETVRAAEIIARAEGLAAHAESAARRK